MDGLYTSREPGSSRQDRIEHRLTQGAHGLLVVVFGLLPILFVPSSVVPLEYSKVLVVVVGLLAACVLYSLATLRSGRVRIAMPALVYALFAAVLASLVSGLLSVDRYDSLVGNVLEVQTTAFTAVLFAVVAIPLILNLTKGMIIRVYMLLGLGALLLVLFHLVRLIAGPTFLSFGLFTSLVSGPFGGWNSLGLFLGLTILLSMIALEQLPLTKWGKGFFALVTVLSLVMLMTINFFAIWVVLGLTSLVVLMYGLVKDRFAEQTFSRDKMSSLSGLSLGLAGIVCTVSVAALLGGSAFGAMVSNVSGVSFIEVRPSLGATLDVTKQVLQDDGVLGAGPNRFADAWRLHKNAAINSSIFWNSDFETGYSYFTTLPATVGVLGGLSWLVFLGLFLFAGFRVTFRPVTHDTLWYFIGTSSFASGLYLWGMALVYTPNTVVLLLAAFFTSTLALSHAALRPTLTLRFSLAENKRAAIVLVGASMLVIVASVALTYGISRHFSAVVMFSDALRKVPNGVAFEEIEAQIEGAYALNRNDVFVRQIAEYQLAKISTLLNLQEPTDIEQEAFREAITRGVVAATRAIEDDPTDSRNHAVAGTIYSVLTGMGMSDTAERARASFAAARAYDPQNPLYPLLEAQLGAREGDIEAARNGARAAIALKPNYTEALLFMADLDIATGNVAGAIDTTRAILALEPANPARYFQLGVLLTASGSTTQATQAFESAVSLDQNYANARYFLARLYASEGKLSEAREQLVIVQKLNPDNQDVAALIAALDAGVGVGFSTTTNNEVTLPEQNSGAPVTASGDPDTPLITPVNIGTGAGTSDEDASDETQVESNTPAS